MTEGLRDKEIFATSARRGQDFSLKNVKLPNNTNVEHLT
jgi:hypothetical protein